MPGVKSLLLLCLLAVGATSCTTLANRRDLYNPTEDAGPYHALQQKKTPPSRHRGAPGTLPRRNSNRGSLGSQTQQLALPWHEQAFRSRLGSAAMPSSVLRGAMNAGSIASSFA